MGLLGVGGRPLTWGEDLMNSAIPHILEHGITQLLILFENTKNRTTPEFLWGEELECTLCVLDSDGKGGDPEGRRSVRVSLRAKEVIDMLAETDDRANWMPEYASYMVENTPKRPYTKEIESLCDVLDNMQHRYEAMARATRQLHDPATHNGTRIAAVTLVSFPLLGVPGTANWIEGGAGLQIQGQYAKSLFIPDECTNMTHPRFSFLTQNIRLRRGRKVCIQIPMFIDVNTLRDTVDKEYSIDAHPNNRLIDCSPEINKQAHAKAFSSSEDDEEDGDDEDTHRNHVKTSSPSRSKSVLLAQQQQQEQRPGAEKTSFQDHFRHLFTPASHYYYAQYVNLDEDREQKVRERFNACPCPTPVREHACVYMDSMCFGMGLSCLQVTMQWKNLSESRHIYDQLVSIAPLFLALTSATPFQKGLLVDSDVRWITISGAVDCRKRDEVPRIVKSRYDNVSMYISDRTQPLEKYNDEHVETNKTVLDRIKAAGIDDRLATHFAHLFIRDPLVVFEDIIHVNDKETLVHFENIQSTNWQSLRFKPPPPGTDIGWRTEFRTMEIQMSGLENAAFSVFVALLAQAIRKFNLFTMIPMSLVSMNMGAAHMRDPVNTQQFWWRVNNCAFTDAEPKAADFARMSLNDIFNGCARFEGFVPLVRRFLREEFPGGEGSSNPRIEAYIELVSRRASGKLKTTATFLREFVMRHPTYKKDSRLTKEIAHDVVELAEKLARGDTAFEDFLPRDLVQMAQSWRRRGRD
jgi:glutamate--cysteine ligase catalytic subunit